MNNTRPVKDLKGIGPTRAIQLSKLGVNTVEDLISFYPRAYEFRGDVSDLSSSAPEVNVSLILTVSTSVKNTRLKGKMTISKFTAFDDSGACEIVFFNSPYVKDVFHVGEVFRFYGKLTKRGSKLTLQNPKYEPYDEQCPPSDIVPVYHLTQGLSSKVIGKVMSNVIDSALSEIIDFLPEYIRLEYELPTVTYAIRNVHFPKSSEDLSRSLARLAFDEMLLFAMNITTSRSNRTRQGGVRFSPCSMKPLTELLPYELTKGQKDALNDIYKDTVIPDKNGNIAPMARIIVGDVGCGKTVCALMAIYLAVKSGYQAAFMVPTEILANQHYQEAKSLLSSLGIRVELLTGHITQKNKNVIYEKLKDGSIDCLIGTHALISDKVIFKNLGLIITDEQHRFGVNQRSVLKNNSSGAHMLVMSATPIPRTLALTMYGDLDVSRILDMPKGRERVDTFVVNDSYRARLNDFISKQVSLGGQCYVVCPSIEDSDEATHELNTISSPLVKKQNSQIKNVKEYTSHLSECLPELRIAALHGRIKSEEKDRIMTAFASGDIDVLVSTTVIEVGVNVPNANLMIVENADRFGLSQLHQLRGRVGRGNRKSYCVLVSSASSLSATKRLEVMRTTYDGYKIAEHDLALRGPGDFFKNNSDDNMRQSGGFDFKFSSMCDDISLIDKAFSAAASIISKDPDLNAPEHFHLKQKLNYKLLNNTSLIS